MILERTPRTVPGLILAEPLTQAELAQRIYCEGRRLVGAVAVPIVDLFASCGTAEAEALLVRSFVGDAPVVDGTLRYQATTQWHRDQTRLVLVVEVLIDLDRLGIDWDRIDDDTPTGADGQPETRSFHHHASRPVGWLLPAQDHDAADDA